VIAREAGASITDFKGTAGLFPKQVLITNGAILEQILPLM
jgi:myo-inositol-1(or 4)-monophosphatase